MTLFKTAILTTFCAGLLAACGSDAPTDKSSVTAQSASAEKTSPKPTDNKMVVLPSGAQVAAALVYPPALPDGSYGTIEVQSEAALTALRNLLKQQNLNLGNVVRLRVTLVAGASGTADYAGFRSAYGKFFGTKVLPSEPVTSLYEARSLSVNGPSVMIEADIAINKAPAPAPSED